MREDRAENGRAQQQRTMRRSLSDLYWTVTGFMPYAWEWASPGEAAADPRAEVPAVPAAVPGSVQAALREAGVLPDWYSGLDSRSCEWVESRHWVYRTEIPSDWLSGASVARLVCNGLDYAGVVRVDGRRVGSFRSSFVPHIFDLTQALAERSKELRGAPLVLEIVFTDVPRRLGQLGYTSEMTDWKIRYNYGWDWTSRVVQIGVWDDVVLEAVPAASLTDVSCRTDVDGLPTMPASADNPLWRRTSWWIEWDAFLTDTGGDAGDASLEEFVSWSQTRQAAALELAATVVKARFPRAGGFIVWMGHDSFPCTANTAVLDFHGRRKPAAEALERVFKSSPESLRKGGAS